MPTRHEYCEVHKGFSETKKKYEGTEDCWCCVCDRSSLCGIKAPPSEPPPCRHDFEPMEWIYISNTGSTVQSENYHPSGKRVTRVYCRRCLVKDELTPDNT